MPAKHTVKVFVADGIYHVFNRGVEKRIIFEDDYDYKVFLNCLKEALLSPDQLVKAPVTVSLKGTSFKGVPKPPKNFCNEIDLLAYCLMPNHFHLLLKQKHSRSMDSFMRSIATRYVIHFNKRYKRVGPLFQGIYKAVLVTDEPYLLHLSRYIHRNPLKMSKDIVDAYSSYADYLEERRTEWLKPQIILGVFKPEKLIFLRNVNSYQKFVEFEEADVNRDEEILSFLGSDDL